LAVLDETAQRALTDLAERGRLRRGLPPLAERKQIRLRAGVSADELANALDVHRDSIFAWESGRRLPYPDFAARYAEALLILSGSSGGTP
jgi:DNA-binding XRE family transcriptional regulator